jgi:predicted transposase/invertase (TIGR01784 family)
MQGVPLEFSEEVNSLLEEDKEVEIMVYNLEVALKKGFSLREQKGEQKGFYKAQKEIAKKMLQMGIEVEKVVEATTLCEDDVRSILFEISN